MPARAARAPRASAQSPAAASTPVVAEPTTPGFTPEEPGAPAVTVIEPEPEPAPRDPQAASVQPPPSGYKGLKVWQRAMDLAEAVHALARSIPAAEQDALAADLRRVAVQVPSYVAAGNSLFQRAEYVQYLSAAHGALARLETLLLVAERLGHVAPADGAPVHAQASQVGYLLRALTRALQPPAAGSGTRPVGRRPPSAER